VYAYQIGFLHCFSFLVPAAVYNLTAPGALEPEEGRSRSATAAVPWNDLPRAETSRAMCLSRLPPAIASDGDGMRKVA
jgi:hypothetical protein